MKLNRQKYDKQVLFSLFHVSVLPFVISYCTKFLSSLFGDPSYSLFIFVTLMCFCPFIVALPMALEKKEEKDNADKKPTLKILS